MRTRFGKRHGWELQKFPNSNCFVVNYRGEQASHVCGILMSTLWRALVRRDPKMFGVEKGRKR